MIKNLDNKNIKRLASNGTSVKATIKQNGGRFHTSADNINLLYDCANDWSLMNDIRLSRLRNLRYKNGEQWSDYVTDPDNPKNVIREDVLISRNGKVPMKFNFIQQFFKNIHGQMLSNPQQTVVHARSEEAMNVSDMLTNTVQACHQLNDNATLDINVLDELLAGGICVAKIGYQFWSEKNRFDARIDLVNTNRIFFNQDFEDPRMLDLRRIGEIHDYSYNDLIRNFAQNRDDERELNNIYANWRKSGASEINNRSRDQLHLLDFFGVASTLEKYRVIEVWERLGRWVTYVHDYLDASEQIFPDISTSDLDNINEERITIAESQGIPAENVKKIYYEKQFEYYWNVKFMTPTGICIKEMETPYKHESHPYVFCVMPVVDGNITPVMNDIIDIQRYINRLIVMIDFIMGSSAKGVLLVPEECIPAGMTLDDYTKSWVKTNGVILVSKSAKDKLPKQVSSNATNVGGWEMLSTVMGIMTQVSGLSGAAQGQISQGGTPASLYAMQAQNSMLNYVLVFDRHNSYCQKRDEKLLKVIMQYYDSPRYVDINGKAYDEIAKYYEPELAKNITDFNLTTSKATNTPLFKQLADNMLMQLLQSGMIPLEVYLNNASMPFADKLKNDIKAFNEQAQGGNIDPAQIEQLASKAGAEADPNAMAMMRQFMGEQ